MNGESFNVRHAVWQHQRCLFSFPVQLFEKERDSKKRIWHTDYSLGLKFWLVATSCCASLNCLHFLMPNIASPCINLSKTTRAKSSFCLYLRLALLYANKTRRQFWGAQHSSSFDPSFPLPHNLLLAIFLCRMQ